MNKTNLNEIARAMADGLREGLCSHKPELFRQLLRLLAEGRPVPLEKLATALDISRDEIKTLLRQLSSVEFDQDRNIVGSGITLTPTPHHFQVSGHELFTWCAFDTIFFPVILEKPAHVESPCPVTGVKVQLTVTPEGVENLKPDTAVVSIVVPEASEACCDVRGAFCNQVHFFSSSEAASSWLKAHQGAIIIPVGDAHQLGRLLSKYLFKQFNRDMPN